MAADNCENFQTAELDQNDIGNESERQMDILGKLFNVSEEIVQPNKKRKLN